MTQPQPDTGSPVRVSLASLRWAAGPEPDTWILLAGGREVGWVGLHPNPDFAAFGWWSWRVEDDRVRAGGTTDSAEAARRNAQTWVAGRLPGGDEDRGEGREG